MVPFVLTPQERASHERARRTYARAVRGTGDAGSGPASVEHLRKVMAARRAGDTAETQRLLKEHQELMTRERETRMATLRAEPDVDGALIDRYIAVADQQPGAVERLSATVGPHLGQLRQDGPDPRGDASAFGVLSREDRRISMPFVRFSSTFHGPPAMVRWLGERGCADLRYAFQPGHPEAELEDGED